jgi:Tol biopolymer transport system component
VWSPSGKDLAFSGVLKRGIYTVGSDGRRLRRLTQGADEDPVFSPDGAALAFTRQTPIGPMEARSDIYVIRPDGKGLRRLTATGTQNFEPAWSPDGGLIAFVEAQDIGSPPCGGDEAIAVMTPTGGERKRLTAYGLYEKPLWSNNETQLAVVGEETPACPPNEGERALYVLSRNGTGQRRVTDVRLEAAGGVAWKPEF